MGFKEDLSKALEAMKSKPKPQDYFNPKFQQYTPTSSGDAKMKSKDQYIMIADRIKGFLFSGIRRKTGEIVEGLSKVGFVNDKGERPTNWHNIVRDVLNKLSDGKLLKRETISSTTVYYSINSGVYWNSKDPFETLNYEFTPMTPRYSGYEKGGYTKPKVPGGVKFEEGFEDNEGYEDDNPLPHKTADTGKLEQRVSDLEDQVLKQDNTIAKLNQKVSDLEDVAVSSVKKIEITIKPGKVITLKNKILPKVYDRILKLAQCKRNILLVGPAGCGKSYIAGLISESLGLQFGSISCTSGMSESHFTGRNIPDLTHGKGKFQSTAFLDCYENGGVFLIDEMDAADPNLLLVINTALANGYCNLPNRPEKPRAKKHDDFIPIATANTFGKGGNRMYVGRSQLDEATMDRFRIGVVECDYDRAVEKSLCPDPELLAKCHDIRDKINAAGLRRVMSTRFIQDAYIMRTNADWSVDDVVRTFVEGWSAEEKAKVVPETLKA